jgi:Lrp/AsnC family leucine-responsive transcriptional regulator
MAKKTTNLNLTLDGFDLDILKVLQQDNSTPQREIAKAVNLSAAAVHRRIRRMQETGVITSNIAVIDPVKVGQPITLFVEVELENEKMELIDDAKKKFSELPQVQQCYYVTGEVDFVLIITVPDMSTYEELTRKLFFSNSNVKKFRTFVTMDRVKVGLSIPI